MSIQCSCSCGKNILVKGDIAGKRIRCPGCGGVVVVPPPTGANVNLMPGATGKPSADLKARAEPEVDDRPRKKKKKKKVKLTDKEKADREYEEWRERSYWRKRITRGIAFLVCGLIIIGGGVYVILNFPSEPLFTFYSAVIILMGVAALVKGALVLIAQEALGEEGPE